MKKFIKGLSAGVLAFFSVVFVGCGEEYLEKKMNGFAVEYEGYTLVERSNDVADEGTYEGEVEIQGKLVSFGQSEAQWFIRYEGKEIIVNDYFMKEKSERYMEIHQLWRENGAKGWEEHTGESDIVYVCCYDNKLFILTDGLSDAGKVVNLTGSAPICLYYYDVEAECVLYAGYCKNFYSQTCVIIKE